MTYVLANKPWCTFIFSVRRTPASDIILMSGIVVSI